MIFRKAVKDDFDNIKSLYWELIDQEQGDPLFPHWKKGSHPSDEMLHNSIGKEELYVLEDGGEIAAPAVRNAYFPAHPSDKIPPAIRSLHRAALFPDR